MHGHYKCSTCGDTWCEELEDMVVSAYMSENPDVDFSGVTDIDLGTVTCEGCEKNSYQDENINETDPNSDYYDPDVEDDDDMLWLICEECGHGFACDLDSARKIWNAEEEGVPVTCGSCDTFLREQLQKHDGAG